jgi:hypothetical protein
MGSVDSSDDLVTWLCARHPWFRRITVARLVERTAAQLAGSHGSAPDTAVRRATEEQLSYAEGSPVPRPDHVIRICRPRRPGLS